MADLSPWLETALNPPRAHGAPLGKAQLRAEPEDFLVEEDLGFSPAGEGQHLLLKVRKRNANTEWVARSLARIAGCRPHDVGFAGLKDRRAVTVQWFTVPRSKTGPDSWTQVAIEGCEVLEVHAHSRKLPRGALAGNRFTLRVREFDADAEALRARLESIRRRGVPNYFGPQRFGRDASNLTRLDQGLRACHPRERGFLLSAARSLIFNAVLAQRVQEGSWDRLEAGDMANLDGRGSIFAVPEVDAELSARCESLDVHPTAPLWGTGASISSGRIQALEQATADSFPVPRDITIEAGMAQERRALRLPVRDLTYEQSGRELVISFRLNKGSYATTVLREIVESTLAEDGQEEA